MLQNELDFARAGLGKSYGKNEGQCKAKRWSRVSAKLLPQTRKVLFRTRNQGQHALSAGAAKGSAEACRFGGALLGHLW